jgi:hypothetical protein
MAGQFGLRSFTDSFIMPRVIRASKESNYNA